ASPHGSITRPSGKVKGVGPSCDAGKEMTLHVSAQVVGSDILDAPFVYVAWRDAAGGDQVADPLRGVRVDLVVVVAHGGHGSRSGVSMYSMWPDSTIRPSPSKPTISRP